jgi:hypothetical protein
MRAALLLAAALSASSAHAVEGARWLLNAEGVRSAALGNAVSALQASSEQVWGNPAGLVGLDGVEASFTHQSFAGAWDSDHVILAAPFHWKHHLGLLYHRNAAEDTLRDNQGVESGNFEVSQSVLGATYAYKGSGWRAGATLKSLSESIASKSASALAYDLGLQADFAQQRVILGGAVQNLGSVPDLGGGPAVDAPLVIRGGTGLRFAGDVSTVDLLVDYRFRPVTGRNGVSIGMEYSERYLDGRLGIRAGYDLSQTDQGQAAGLGLGLGLGIGAVGLDYAWTPRGDLGSQHRIALNLLWDLRARARRQALDEEAGPSQGVDVLKPEPTAVLTPERGSKGFVENNAGARLDALLASGAPTPVPTPTPVVQEQAPPARGILGFFASLFTGKGKTEGQENGEKEESHSLLQGLFHFMGLGGNEAAPVTTAPESPERANEDSFDQGTPGPSVQPTPTALPMQKLKGDSSAVQPTPTPQPMKQKVKEMIKF